jgi:hypothetical protein
MSATCIPVYYVDEENLVLLDAVNIVELALEYFKNLKKDSCNENQNK